MAPVYPVYPNQYSGTGAYYGTTGANATTIWLDWNTTNTTVTAASSLQIWNDWIAVTGTGSQQPGIIPRQTTPEEIERHKRVAAERKQKAELAKQRARAVLLETLSDEQRVELEREGHFHIETRDGQRRYRLRPGSPPIRIHGEDGRRWAYCIHPNGSFPQDDVTLALKLMLETDEDRFLSVANASPV